MIYQVTEPVELEYNGHPLVVLFTNNLTCAPCKMFHPHFEKVAGEMGEEASFAEVDILENMELTQRYGVSRTPTVLFIDENGPVELKSRTALQLMSEINSVLGN